MKVIVRGQLASLSLLMVVYFSQTTFRSEGLLNSKCVVHATVYASRAGAAERTDELGRKRGGSAADLRGFRGVGGAARAGARARARWGPVV